MPVSYAGSLPNRQLRKGRVIARIGKGCSLPNRQLRNEEESLAITPPGSLPNRQLRNTDFGTAWAWGFSLVVGSYLIGWAAGVVLRFISSVR